MDIIILTDTLNNALPEVQNSKKTVTMIIVTWKVSVARNLKNI